MKKLLVFIGILLISVVTKNSALCCQNVESNNTKVLQVYIMFRHGARSWYQNYPNEPLSKDIWNSYGGYSQLTSIGKKQMNDFGIYFKNYYKNIGINEFDYLKVVAKSTDKNRTIDSTNAFLFSIFDKYFPINEILDTKKNCPRYGQLRKWSRNGPEYQNISQENKKFIKNMSRLSGIENLDYYNMWQIADHILVNDAHNLTNPLWVNENKKKILEANDYTFYIDFLTTEMAQLISGPLLNDIVTNMKKRIFSESFQQLFVYGIHDNYISGMQKLLEYSETFLNPNFGSAYIFELRKDSKCNYFVRVLYKNDESIDEFNLAPIVLPGCDDEICSIHKFLNLTINKLVEPQDFDKLCEEI